MSHILIIGTGSVGRRHARNFSSLGCQVSCMDPRRDRLEQAGSEVTVKHQFVTLEDAFARADEFAGIVICSPPMFHVEQSLAALKLNVPVLLEKPASVDVKSCRPLQAALEQGGTLLLGYTYRWSEPMRRLKTLIQNDTIGPLRHARFTMSAHLADWHPWERYQDFFMSSRELGGGALLDESHFIDLMLWFFGMPDRVIARVETISDLEITTDDLVDIIVVYPQRFRVTVHLDLFGRPHDKQIVVVGERGTLQCSFNPDRLRIGHAAEPIWTTEEFSHERNAMFLGVAREFVDIIEGRVTNVTCTFQDGLNVLNVLDACRQSQQTGCEAVLQ